MRCCPSCPRCASSRSATSPAPRCGEAVERGLTQVVFVGMVGKLTKLAAGVLMTHYTRSQGRHAACSAGSPRAAAATRTGRSRWPARTPPGTPTSCGRPPGCCAPRGDRCAAGCADVLGGSPTGDRTAMAAEVAHGRLRRRTAWSATKPEWLADDHRRSGCDGSPLPRGGDGPRWPRRRWSSAAPGTSAPLRPRRGTRGPSCSATLDAGARPSSPRPHARRLRSSCWPAATPASSASSARCASAGLEPGGPAGGVLGGAALSPASACPGTTRSWSAPTAATLCAGRQRLPGAPQGRGADRAGRGPGRAGRRARRLRRPDPVVAERLGAAGENVTPLHARPRPPRGEWASRTWCCRWPGDGEPVGPARRWVSRPRRAGRLGAARDARTSTATRWSPRRRCGRWCWPGSAPGLGELVWDVGAGSGSVAVECARFGAAVVAVERDPAACARIRAQRRLRTAWRPGRPGRARPTVLRRAA